MSTRPDNALARLVARAPSPSRVTDRVFSERALAGCWLAAVLWWGVGDVATTAYIFHSPLFSESNAFVVTVGFAWFVALKVGVLTATGLFSRWVASWPLRGARAAPLAGTLALAALGGYATLHNLLVFSRVLF